jgi:hypothetical protein
MVTLRSGCRGLGGAIVAVAALLAPATAAAAPQCPISYGQQDAAKPNKLYAYFPATADSTFPEFGTPDYPATSPAQPFDIAQLSSYSGTDTDLRNGVTDVIADDYCELNVQVLQTTGAPPTTVARRNVVAIGTDDNTELLYGLAQDVDTGDADPIDNARVWAGRYQSRYGGPGGELNGANSTLERWANAIGGTVAHEAGHNYGLSHSQGALVAPGEDALTRHIMPAGRNLNGEQRAGYRRHFNDANFATLASNVGLSIQTMHNWDLTNPNAETAHQFRLTFLSPQAAPIVSWAYQGELSPWGPPTLSSSLGTQTFKGTTYNRFQLTWSVDKSWANGNPGEVPGARDFHVGATFSDVDFNDPDPIVITRSELLDESGNPLSLQPRLVAYDEGEPDTSDGSFDMAFDNAGRADVQLRDVTVVLLPRVLSIDAMVPGPSQRFFDWSGERFRPYKGSTRRVLRRARRIRRKGRVVLTVARLSDRRPLLERFTDKHCAVQDRAVEGRDTVGCRLGYNAGLFPATTMYVRATVVSPRARQWDPRRRAYVRRSLTSRIFYQVGGIRPDLNRNGVDDAIDIRRKRSIDRNRDGVPDKAQRRGD